MDQRLAPRLDEPLGPVRNQVFDFAVIGVIIAVVAISCPALFLYSGLTAVFLFPPFAMAPLGLIGLLIGICGRSSYRKAAVSLNLFAIIVGMFFSIGWLKWSGRLE